MAYNQTMKEFPVPNKEALELLKRCAPFVSGEPEKFIAAHTHRFDQQHESEVPESEKKAQSDKLDNLLGS